MSTLVTFEHPIQEDARVLLRLEYHFNQMQQGMTHKHPLLQQQALIACSELLHMCYRADIKKMMMDNLTKLHQNLQNQEQIAEISKLAIIDQLNQRWITHHNQGLDRLQQDPLIRELNQQRRSQAGLSGFNTPTLQHWLNSPHAQRIKRLTMWMESFDLVYHSQMYLLKALRHSEPKGTHPVNHQSLQIALERKQPIKLVRVTLAKKHGVFPVVSANHHHLSLRLCQYPIDHPDGSRVCPPSAQISVDITLCAWPQTPLFFGRDSQNGSTSIPEINTTSSAIESSNKLPDLCLS